MKLKSNEIEIIRVYDAPVKLVWEAWTDLKHVEKWWGPRGFTLTTKSKDFSPGGKWIYTMHGPDGTDYPNIATYHEIIPYEKLVYDHGGNEDRPKLFSVIVSFKEDRGKTVMCMRTILPTAEEAKTMMQFIRQANGTSTWDRLGEFLIEKTQNRAVFCISRLFTADKNRVVEAFSNTEKRESWLLPEESGLSVLDCDFQKSDRALWTVKLKGMKFKARASIHFVAMDSMETRI
ncbi:MAG: SRPBCC domain-containing protein, partial [Candidatus Cloacimonetes bacterium]|nr:SRPBCC domain-containing protein [Candidatus Cloacimonadota bacterium]